MADHTLLGLVEPWDVEEAGEIVTTRVFTLRQRKAASRTHPEKRGEFVYLDAPDWVNVVALTANQEVVLIEQFRHGTAENTLEIPGGMVDEGESPVAAGIRELREETGYSGDDGRPIGAVTPNPALQNNRCHTILVRNVELRHPVQFDGNEEIAVRLAPLSDIAQFIRDGSIHHALVVAAFHHLSLLS